MTRRSLLIAGLSLAPACAGSVPGLAIRGKLIQTSGQTLSLELPGNVVVALEGDEATLGVLNDKRLAGVDLEAIGHYAAQDRFAVDPIHTKALFVHKDGKRFAITYWCDVCYIRTYTPGVCWCCQKYTDLDLRESEVR